MMGAAVAACVIDHTPSDTIHRMVYPDGTVVWVHARATWVVDDDGQGRVIGTALDITDRKMAEIALHHQALHDTLTRLANKALFVDRMVHALHRAKREATPVAVLFIDLDNFQTVNDALGHTAGDQLIAAVAQRVEDATSGTLLSSTFVEVPGPTGDFCVRAVDSLRTPRARLRSGRAS